MLFLRPLLLFFSYSHIRYLNIFLHTFTLCLAFHSLSLSLGKRFGFLYVFLWSAVYVNIFPLSLHFSTSTLTTHMAMFALLELHKGRKLQISNLYLYFLVVGSVVAFIDIWTFQLVSLGLPFVAAFLLMRMDTNIKKTSQRFVYVLLQAIYWTIGYAGTYIIKWVGCWLFDPSSLNITLSQLALRMGGDENALEAMAIAWKRNVDLILTNKPLVLLLFLLLLFSLVMICTKYKAQWKRSWKGRLLLLLPTVYPFLWIIAFSNQSRIHYWFIYRILIVSIFSVFGFLFSFFEKKSTSPSPAAPSKCNLESSDACLPYNETAETTPNCPKEFYPKEK